MTEVDYRDVRKDIDNYGSVVLIPQVLLEQDVINWQFAGITIPSANGGHDMASFYEDQAAATSRLGLMALAASKHESDASQTLTLVQHIIARYAHSRFVRLVAESVEDTTYVTDADSEVKSKGLGLYLDFDEFDITKRSKAFKTVVRREILAEQPLKLDPLPSEKDTKWYQDGNNGLYLRCTTPGSIPDGMLQGLASAIGNPAEAAELLAPEETAVIQPYVSTSYLFQNA